MSASLVGSEMCIRDRSRRPHPRKQGPQQEQWQQEQPSSWQGCPRQGPRTVSYTHLTLPTICSV
eukprot:9140353-Alexandrium_andersonii.AAC.1